MEKKVLQDIMAPETRDPKKGPTRKWNYNNGGLGMVKNTDVEENLEQDSQKEAYDEEESNQEPPMETKKEAETYTTSYYNDNDSGKRKKHSRRSLVGWIIGGIVFGVVSFVVGWTFFATAVVEVTPTQQTTSIDDTFSAIPQGGTDGDVTYKIVKLQQVLTQDVQPTGEKNVQNKATGKIIISGENEKSTKLVANTRFQSPDDKIYRIAEAVVVPAAKKDADGKLVRSSVEVTVFADQPGDAYNIGIVDFKIPGLVGTDLESKYTARGATEMTGGYSGILKYASDEDVLKATETMQKTLKEKLLADIASSIDSNTVLYDDAIFVDFKTNIPTKVSENGMLQVEEVGFLQAFVFDRSELSGMIAKKTLNPYDGSPVRIENLDDIGFTFEAKDTFDAGVNDTFKFALKGDLYIAWEIDALSLKKDLAGLDKDNMLTIAKDHPSIKKIEATVKPFWKKTFPSNPEAITIEESTQ